MRGRRSSSGSPGPYGYPFQPTRSISPDFAYGEPDEEEGPFYRSQQLASLYGGYPPPYPTQQEPQLPPRPTSLASSQPKKQGSNGGPVVVAIMGATGSGKSTFLTACGGIGFKSGHCLASETKEPLEWSGTYKGVSLTLVDTPGFGDTNLPDSVILEKISQWLQKNFEEGKKINGIIYLHRITDNRMTHIGVKNIKMFKNLCGANAMKNAILCTSFWDAIDKQVGEDRERELRNNYWKNMIGLGASIERHDNTKLSATRILDKILSQNGVSLKLQEELAEGKKLGETVAGRTIIEDVGQREMQVQAMLRELKQEYDNALEERDADMKRMIEEERERMFDQIRLLEEDKLRLEQRLDEIQSKVPAPGRFSRWAKRRADAVFKTLGFEIRRLPPPN